MFFVVHGSGEIVDLVQQLGLLGEQGVHLAHLGLQGVGLRLVIGRGVAGQGFVLDPNLRGTGASTERVSVARSRMAATLESVSCRSYSTVMLVMVFLLVTGQPAKEMTPAKP